MSFSHVEIQRPAFPQVSALGNVVICIGYRAADAARTQNAMDDLAARWPFDHSGGSSLLFPGVRFRKSRPASELKADFGFLALDPRPMNGYLACGVSAKRRRLQSNPTGFPSALKPI